MDHDSWRPIFVSKILEAWDPGCEDVLEILRLPVYTSLKQYRYVVAPSPVSPPISIAEVIERAVKHCQEGESQQKVAVSSALSQARITMSNEEYIEPPVPLFQLFPLHGPVRDTLMARANARRRVGIFSIDRGGARGGNPAIELPEKAPRGLDGPEIATADYFHIINRTSTEGPALFTLLPPRILHRDFTTDNILVSIAKPVRTSSSNPSVMQLIPTSADLIFTGANSVVNLGDFGDFRPQSWNVTRLIECTRRWRAREVFNDRKASEGTEYQTLPHKSVGVQMWAGVRASEDAYARDAVDLDSDIDIKCSYPELEGTEWNRQRKNEIYTHIRQANVYTKLQAEPVLTSDIVRDIGSSRFHTPSTKPTSVKESSEHFRARFRPWVAEIRVPVSITRLRLRTFNTEADGARRFVKCKKPPFSNFPCDDLNAYSQGVPPNSNLNSLRDDSVFKDVTLFVKRKAQDYAASFCPNKTACIPISADQILAKKTTMEPRDEEFREKYPENAYLKAVKADLTGDDSMCPSLEPDAHEWVEKVADVEDEEGNDGSSAMDESEAEVTADSPCLETNSNYAGRKRKSVDDDDLITKLAPFIKQQIEHALNSTLLPLVSVLRNREEDEQKHREQMLALEEEKLALKREKLLFKRRRVALSQPNIIQREPHSARLGFKKRHGLRVKIPVL